MKAESTATFYAALKNSDDTLANTTQFKNVSGADGINTRSICCDLDTIGGLIKSGSNEVVNKGYRYYSHKDGYPEMSLKLFEQSREFKIGFAREFNVDLRFCK